MKKCRACLKMDDAEKMCPFDDKIIECFNLLTNLSVKFNDIMPQQICESCLGMLHLFTEFRNKCLSTDSILLDMHITEIIKDEEITSSDIIDIKHIKEEHSTYKQDFLSDDNDSVYSKINQNVTYELILKDIQCTEVDSKRLKSRSNKPSATVYSCGLCIKEFNNKKLLLSHLNEHKTNSDSVCDLCLQKFTDWHQLLSHRLEHLKNKNEKECHICFSKFTSPPFLEYHYKKLHSMINHPILQCLSCNESYTTPQQLRRHIWKSHVENKYNCSYCSQRFNDENKFKNHIARHKQNNVMGDVNAHPCDSNAKNSSSKARSQCQLCSKWYTTSIKLREHIRRMHSDNTYICDYCSKQYSYKDILKSHIKRSHLDHKIYTCNKCEYSSTFMTNLKFHKIRKHTIKRVYCTGCSRVFCDQKTLDAHKCQIKSLVCSTCGKVFKANKQLRRHMVSHEAAGRYACALCPARLRSRTAWRAHCDRHNGVRAHACPRCPAAFYSPSVLTKHMRTHTGIKPYVCKICEKGFTGNNNLKVHMKVHGEYLIKKKVKNEDEEKLQKI